MRVWFTRLGLTQDVDAILGRDFLKKHGCSIEMSPTHNVLHFRQDQTTEGGEATN